MNQDNWTYKDHIHHKMDQAAKLLEEAYQLAQDNNLSLNSNELEEQTDPLYYTILNTKFRRRQL